MIRLFTFAFILSVPVFVTAQDATKKKADAPAAAKKKAAPAEKKALAPAEKKPEVLAEKKTDDADKKTGELDLSSVRLKASYAIGVSIGQSLMSDGMEVDVATLAAGLRASLAGTNSKLTSTESRAAITAFQQEMQGKLAEKRKVQAETNKVEGKAFLAKNEKKAGVVTLESGLQYEVIKRGKVGKRPTKEDRVSAHYHGTLLDGTVFDSSVEREEPLEIGVSGVIAGWTEALQLMNVGDKWRLFVPSHLAYEDRGAGSDIGPHATLIFEVELLEIK